MKNHPVLKKQEIRKYLDEALDVIKIMQNKKESFQFKSESLRFK